MSFDADAFLDSAVQGEMSTSITPCPEGDFMGIIVDDFGDNERTFQEVETKDGPRIIMRVPWKITSPEVIAQLGRDNVIVRQDIWLDFTPEGGLDIAEGKNTQLGALREALGQNSESAWSPRNLRGAGPALVHVEHRPNDKNPDAPYANVTRVAAA